MGIVNAGQLAVYQDIPAELLELVEDVLFDRREDATDRLVTFASTVSGSGTKRTIDLSWRETTVRERLSYAPRTRHRGLHRGGHRRGPAAGWPVPRGDRRAVDGRHEDRWRPVRRGQMFLPQVVKSAR